MPAGFWMTWSWPALCLSLGIWVQSPWPKADDPTAPQLLAGICHLEDTFPGKIWQKRLVSGSWWRPVPNRGLAMASSVYLQVCRKWFFQGIPAESVSLCLSMAPRSKGSLGGSPGHWNQPLGDDGWFRGNQNLSARRTGFLGVTWVSIRICPVRKNLTPTHCYFWGAWSKFKGSGMQMDQRTLW